MLHQNGAWWNLNVLSAEKASGHCRYLACYCNLGGKSGDRGSGQRREPGRSQG
ncbi:MAG: hypothetical protein GY889_15440 [Proteobacteria bacterium]|nr:hypothetical protein [Pseudomonadota bacterium]